MDKYEVIVDFLRIPKGAIYYLKDRQLHIDANGASFKGLKSFVTEDKWDINLEEALFWVSTVVCNDWVKRVEEKSVADRVREEFSFFGTSESWCLEAQRYIGRHYTVALARIKRYAEIVNDGWVPDWENGQDDKYYTYYRNLSKQFSIDSYTNAQTPGETYYKSDKLAHRAAIDMRPEYEVLAGLRKELEK
jgi:hypothetical protein